MDERETGVVKWFNDKRVMVSFPVNQEKNIFVHYSSIPSEGFRSLKEG